MESRRSWRSVAWAATAVLLLTALGCSSSTGRPSGDATPPHTEPTDPAALFAPPADDLHAVLDPQGLSEDGVVGPLVEENGHTRALNGTHGWSIGWTTDVGSTLAEVVEMPNADDAARRVEAVVEAAPQVAGQGSHEYTFNVPGIGGAVGVEFDPPPDRTTTISEVFFPLGTYFVGYTIIADHGHGMETVTQMAQAEAAYLRELG